MTSETALILAKRRNDTNTTRILWRYGARVCCEDFVKFCKSGDVKEVEEAIKNGADVNTKDKYGWTILMWAAGCGHTDVAELLLKHGAKVNAESDFGYTALMYAAGEGRTDVAELLLKHGADVNAKDKYGETALIKATEKGRTETANLLRKYGAR